MIQTREELIKEYDEKIGHKFPLYIGEFVDLLIADRLKVVEPLVKLPNKDRIAYEHYVAFTTDAISQTLRNAGVS
jgi:hypothetical protein